MRKLKAALLGGVMMLGALTGAQAADETTKWQTTSSGWEIDVNYPSSGNVCSASRTYPEGTTFVMAYNREARGYWIGIGRDDWAYKVSNGAHYDVTLVTDGTRWQSVSFHGLVEPGKNGAYVSDVTFNRDFIIALAKANKIEFLPGNNTGRWLTLDGSYEALVTLGECQKAQGWDSKQQQPGLTQSSNDGPWSVPVQRQGANVTLSVRLNDGEKLTFMLDTGATAIGIPQDLADRLGLKAIRWIKVNYGDGSSGQEAVVMLDKVALNGVMLRNVEATVGPKGSPLLLGKNFLDRFGSYAIDNRQSVLILSK